MSARSKGRRSQIRLAEFRQMNSAPERDRPGIFLTAEWRHLVILNYSIERRVIEPLVPAGLELDEYQSTTYVSIVGFLFLNTRVGGISFPFHRDFEEVNLRFYVRHRSEAGWRRGVVFVREIVPRRAIATLARVSYGEPYSAFPMRHWIESSAGKLHCRYEWQRDRRTEFVAATAVGEPKPIEPGSLEEFITEHYWGYTARGGRCTQYQVEHPPWRVWQTTDAKFEGDVPSLYGKAFVEPLSAPPASAFIAEGSAISVRRGSRLV
jgi:uncharacterized protein YqjF (DUF2071 family)